MKELSEREISKLKRAIIQRGFKLFDNGPYDLNVISIRSNVTESDKFDDVLCVIFKKSNRMWYGYSYPITTDPGKHWLLNPLNKKGTLILKANEQYLKMFKMGFHGRSGSNPYRAPEQVGSGIYVRDNNKDSLLDFSLFKNPANWIRGVFKTNIHRASFWKRLFNIGKYSAGCQVFADPNDFDHFMELFDKQINNGYGDYLSYTLFTQKYFDTI